MGSMLAMRDITKRFPGVLANDSVNFDVEIGEIHALIGENGAGKTTLMNILYGLYRAEEGKIYYRGKEVEINSSREAIALKIGMVHQHFMLIPTFTVAENIALGLKSSRGLVLDTEIVAQKIQKLSEDYKLKVDPNARVSELPVGVQQRVEILKALYRGADLLVLDEPTGILTPQETEELFSILRYLSEQGHSIIFISHKLKEIMDISDRITVLRRGKYISTVKKEDTNIQELATMMVGREMSFSTEKVPTGYTERVLEVTDLSAIDERNVKVMNRVNFSIKKGEIFGVAGVEGNGQMELAETLAGLRNTQEGSMKLNGIEIANLSPKMIIEAGLSYIPADRNSVGVVGKFSVAENSILKSQDSHQFARKKFLKSKVINEHAQKLLKSFDIRTSSINVQARTLSGGNIQKLILAREVDRRTPLLIAVQPTRGLDFATMKFIQQELLSLRNEGKSILLISTELDEILALSDRIAVIYEGEIMDILRTEDVTKERLGLLMAGMKSKVSETR